MFWALTSDYYSVHSRVWILIWWKWHRLLPPNASFLYTNRVLHLHIINKMVQMLSCTLTASQKSLSRFRLPLPFWHKVPSSFPSLIHSKTQNPLFRKCTINLNYFQEPVFAMLLRGRSSRHLHKQLLFGIWWVLSPELRVFALLWSVTHIVYVILRVSFNYGMVYDNGMFCSVLFWWAKTSQYKYLY